MNMRVLFVLDSLGAGGAERSTALLLPYLRARGLEISIAVLRSESQGSELEVREQGFKVHVIPGTGALQRLRGLRSIIAAEQPDVVHTAVYSADQFGRVAAAGTRTRVVSSLINVPRQSRLRSDFDPPAWKVATVNALDAVTGLVLVDRFHAVTSGVADLHAKAHRLNPKRISVVERGRPSAVSTWRAEGGVSDLHNELGLATGDRIVFAAGRQEHQKGHVDLVRAIGLLVDRDPRIHLVIAGRAGNGSADLLRVIRNTNGASGFVHLLGHRDDVAELLATADVMALPSHYEGTAGIVLEAMSVGTPIVSTELQGMSGILEHNRNSLLVAVQDPAAMAQALDQVLNDPLLAARLGEEARRDFLSRFTLERSADRMVAMYQSVVAAPRRWALRRR